jgi:hypothetical protein
VTIPTSIYGLRVWPLLLLIACGCGIGFEAPKKPVQPVEPDTPTPIVRDVFDAAEFSAALADEAKLASDQTSEKGSEIVQGTLRQYERMWPSAAFGEYQKRLLTDVPGIELSGGKARDLTDGEIKSIREAR